MKNKDAWKPTKFVYRRGKLRSSLNHSDVDVASRLMVNLIARFYESSVKKYASGHLLDLGCGNVPLYQTYKECVTDNTCADWENSLHKNQHIDCYTDLNKPLPFADDSFNTLILSDVLEHIKNPEVLWSEMHRVLASGGYLLLNVPFYYWLHEEPNDYYRYTKYRLQSFAEEAGFSVTKLEELGGVPEVLTDISAKTLSHTIPLIGKPLAKLYQRLTWFFINTRLGKKFSVKTATNFPFGYGMVVKKN
jgi:SAM-dependent methyltransferase